MIRFLWIPEKKYEYEIYRSEEKLFVYSMAHFAYGFENEYRFHERVYVSKTKDTFENYRVIHS